MIKALLLFMALCLCLCACTVHEQSFVIAGRVCKNNGGVRCITPSVSRDVVVCINGATFFIDTAFGQGDVINNRDKRVLENKEEGK